MRLPQKKTKSAHVGKGLEVFVDEEFTKYVSFTTDVSDLRKESFQELGDQYVSVSWQTLLRSLCWY